MILKILKYISESIGLLLTILIIAGYKNTFLFLGAILMWTVFSAIELKERIYQKNRISTAIFSIQIVLQYILNSYVFFRNDFYKKIRCICIISIIIMLLSLATLKTERRSFDNPSKNQEDNSGIGLHGK